MKNRFSSRLLAPVISLLVILLALAAGIWGGVPVMAHDPELHNFRLTAFRHPVKAPAFSWITPDGKKGALEDLKGQVILLNFWATWCPPCIKEMPSIEKLYKAYRKRGFTVLAISVDVEGAEIVKPFVKRLALTFPIALDPKSEISRKYGAGNLPSSYLINRKGMVIASAKGERDWFSKAAINYFDELIASGGSS